MLYMIIEEFKSGPAPVYARFKKRGRMAPNGLTYIGSWVTSDMSRCYQVMECAERELLEDWMAHWSDLVRFEVVPLITSAEAAQAAAALH